MRVRAVLGVGIGLLGVAWALACSGPAYPKCESDAQCRKDRDGKAITEYCLFGQCSQCAQDSQCGAGEMCNKGRCDKACAADGDCANGQVCDARACVPAECSGTKACSDGASCNAGRCSPQSSVAPTGDAAQVAHANADCDRHKTVHFDFNAADLKPDARQTLEDLARCMRTDASWGLTIEGHCDERGTTEYNIQLGERRADVLRDYLVRLGADKKRIRTISYGKEHPLDPSPTEEAWAKNRRGELVFQ